MLLSADAFLAAASMAGGAHAQHGQISGILAAHEESFVAQAIQPSAYNPADQVGDIFEGLTGEAIASSVVISGDANAASETPSEASSSSPIGASHDGDKPAAPAVAKEQKSPAARVQSQSPTATQTHAQAEASSTTISGSKTTSSASTTSGSGSEMTQQLTTTLKAANAPPAGKTASPENHASAAQTSNSQSVANSSSNSKAPTASGAPASLSDLAAYIQGKLNDATASFTATESFDSVALGDFLQLNGVTLTFNATLTEGTWSGSVTISATSATLFSGKTFSAAISNQVIESFKLADAATSVTLSQNPVNNSAVTVQVNGQESTGQTVTTKDGVTTVTFPGSQPKDTVIDVDYQVQYAVTGTYTIGGKYSLVANNLVLRMGDALLAVANHVTLTYDTAGAENQNLATISGATVRSPQFNGFGSATLTNFELRADGFSFDAFTLQSTSSVGIGSLLTASTATLTAEAINVSFGTSTESASVTGTVSLTLSGLQLFPLGGFIQATTTSVTGSYSFAAFDGVGASGELSLTISGLELSIGPALKIVATGDVTLTPGQDEVATILSATITSPEFPQVGTATITNLKLLQTGFSVDDLTLVSSTPGNLGGFLTFSSVKLTVKNFVFDYDTAVNPPTPPANDPAYVPPKVVNGTVEIEVDQVQLFPNVSFLNISLDKLTGSYTFGAASELGASARLSIGIPNLDIAIGEALTIHLGNVTIQPADDVILSLDEATVSSNLFSGLGTATITDFELTKTGFSLGSFTIDALLDKTLSLGGFLEFGSVSIVVTDLKVDTQADPILTGSIAVTVGDMVLFPGNSVLTSSFGNITIAYDFASPGAIGQLTITTESFSLNIGNQLSLSGEGLVITPDQETIATLQSATLTLTSLNNLTATIADLAIQKNGFSIASATVTTGDITLGGLFSLTAPEVTFTNVSYVMGGGLSGEVEFQAAATLNLGGAIQTTASQITANYNFETHVFNASIENFEVNVGGFVSITGSGVAVSYQPADDGTSKILVGATGMTVLMGAGSGSSAVGVQISDANLALAIFKSTDGTITYALNATGGIALVGLPADTLSFSADSVTVRVNNAGAVEELVNVDSDPDHAVALLYEANEKSLLVSDLTLTIGSFVTLTGDFGFQTFTDSETGLTNIAIGAANVNAVLGAADTNLTITGASLGLLIRPGAGVDPTTYALIANGGTDILNGVPGVSLSASGLKVKVNTTGLDPETLANLPQNILTPDGSLPIDFSELGAGDILSVEGSITLNLANFLSLKGDFAFQTFTDPNSGLKDIVIAATNVDTVLGTESTNLTITGASLGLAILAGANGSPSTYLLVVNGGTDTLNGIPGLELNASGLKVRVNTTGVDPTTLPIPQTLTTPGGSLDLDFSDLGSGLVKDVQGSITLTVAGFVTLHGDFGFQAFTDSTTGLTNMAIGATGVTAVLGTDAANLTIDGASLGVLVIAGSAGNPTRYALVANGGTDTLNGIPGLSLSASGLSVKINNLGADPSSLPGVPTVVHTSGGDVALDFAGLGAGSTKTIEGTITLEILDFVSLHGSFSFQTFTDLITGANDIAIAATDVDASLTVGNVSLLVDGASLGLLIIPGAVAGQSTYALVANGGDDSLVGIPGLSLSASGLSVRINTTGLDIEEHVGSTTISTPGGDVEMDFSDLGSGAVMSVEGHITLNIAGFVSLSGDFGFQKYTDTVTSQTRMLVGAKNLDVFLGTDDTNLTITGASLGLLILPGVGTTPGTYALVANGGTASLNGVPGLSLTSTGLSVKLNNTGLDPETLAAEPVHTSGGDVVLDFGDLGAGNVTHIEGTVSLTVADFVSISGSFVFTKQVDPNNANITKIVVGASGVTTFLGTEDQSVGVRIHDANLGMVIYKNTVANTSTYALYASTQIETVGLPSEISLTGNAALMINNTGKAVNENIVTQSGDVLVKFTDGTNGTSDQRNIKAFSGGLTLTINAGSSITLTGNFSFSKVGVGAATKVLIGASGVSCSNIIPDGGSGSLELVDGSLGLVLFSDAAGGYALTASATVAAGAGGSSASATVTIRRNTTDHAVNETVSVATAAVQVKFSATEIRKGTTAFQSIALSDATINIDNIFIITAGGGSTSVVGGVTTKTMTGVSLTVQDPGTGKVLFMISADSASYITILAGTVFDGITWTNGGSEIILDNLSFSLGGYVTFTGDSVKIKHYTTATNVAVNAFNFTKATVSLYVDSTQMAALQGNLAFHYSTTDGFVLDSTGAAPITGFSFLGQSIGDVTAPAGGAAVNEIPTVPPPPVTHTLGPITFGTPSIGFSSFSFGLDGTLSVRVAISDTLASINGGVVTAAVKNITGSFDLGLKLDLGNPFAPPSNVTASGFTLKVGQFEIAINIGASISLKLTGTNVFIDPTAGPTNDLVSFGGTASSPGLAATLSVPGLTLTGGASNFSVKGNGSFVAGNNFSVTLALGQNSASSLKWPAWLPIQNVAITVEWPNGNFNSDPGNFILDLSATVNLNSLKGIPLAISGTVNHVRIDVSELAAGHFPIVGIESVAISVSGNLFGGTVSGSLLAGVVRFDSNGAVVDSAGKLVSNGQPGVGEISSVFYGGINASFSFGGMTGFTLRLGISEYGPLSVYIAASTPTGILLDPQSGLTINNFRGGVTFGQGLPTVNISDPIQAADALQLRQPGFQSPATMTDAQWLAQMKAQVGKLYKDGPTDGWSNLGASTITIQAGATVYDAYLSQNAFKIDADIFFDTSGKILILGTATFGNTLTLGVKLYADLSPIFNGTVSSGNPVNILFLMDSPAQIGTPIAPPILSIYGVMQFEFSRVDGTEVTASNQADAFQINIAGAAELNVLGGFQAKLSGNVSLTFTATSFQIVIFNVSLTMSYLGEVGTAAGNLTIQKNASGGLEIFGALVLNANLQALTDAGIKVNGGAQVSFQINTTGEVKTVPLVLTTGTINVDLRPQSFSLLINGGADFELFGQRVFSVSGTLAVNLNISSTDPLEFTLTIFVQVQLMIGPVGAPFFTYNANGLIYVDQTGFAAKVTLVYAGSPLPGFTLGENWILVMNTTGRDISYEIPAPIPTAPTVPSVPTVMGPNFNSTNVLALTSYETIVSGKRMLIIPKGAPPSGTTDFANWNASVAGPYVIFVGRGSLSLANAFTISGNINLVASYNSLTGLSFAFSVNATLNLAVNGTNIFSFSVLGSLQIDQNGLVAALAISRSSGFNMPSNLGFTLNVSFMLQINTTNAPVTAFGTSITVQPGARVSANGTLSVPGLTITGKFDFTVSPTSLTVEIKATVNIFGALMSVNGFAGIYYDSNPGFAFSIQLKVGSSTSAQIQPVSALGNLFSISGEFTLQINTSSVTRNSIASGFKIAITNLDVFLFGFHLSGTVSIGISSAGLSINIPTNNPLKLDFFHLATFEFSGYLNPNGTFSFTASAAFSFGEPGVAYLGGSISITISNSGFSASVAGRVDFLGVSVGAGGTLTITNRSVDVDIYIRVVVIPAINIDTPAVKVAGVTIIPAVHIHTDAVVVEGTFHYHFGQTEAPPPPPPTPVLATSNGTTLVLNLGADAVNRGALFGALSTEEYVLTHVAGDPGSSNGQTIQVTALGYTQTYYNVKNIVVRDTSTADATIQIANEITATADITLGNGNNAITSGGGYTTIRDKGTGINTIVGGNGGGVYIAGLNGSNNPYATKGVTTVNTSLGNFSVQYAGYANYTLTQTLLQAGTFLVYLNGVTSVSLTATTATGAHTFNLSGWYGSGAINGNGSDNTLNVNPQTGVNTTFVLADTALQLTIGNNATQTMTLSGVQTANLTGGSSSNTFTVSGWSGHGSLTGLAGSTNTVVAVNNANFTLTNTQLTRTGASDLQLTNIANAVLSGGVGVNTFTVDGDSWTGHATLNGIAGNDVYNLTLSGSGTTWFTIADLTVNSGDVLNVTITVSPLVTEAQLKIGGQKVDYSGVGVLNINGTLAGTIYNVRSTNGSTTTNLFTFGAENVINVGSNAGSATAGKLDSILGALTVTGNGTDTLNIDDSANSTAKNGSLTALALTGLSTGEISYNGASVLNISLGSAADTMNVLSTNATTLTTIKMGAGNDIINVGGTGSSGVLDGVAGELILNGESGSNTLNFDDSGSVTGKIGFLSATTLLGSGLGAEGVTFSGIQLLNVSLGSGNDVLNVLSTDAGTLTTINTGAGSNTLNVSDNAPAGTGGVLTGIAGKLILNGQGVADVLNLDDSGDPFASTVHLTSTMLTGLGMANDDATKGLEFHGLETLNIFLGANNNALYLHGSPADAVTNIVTGSGTNIVAIGTNASAVPGELTNGDAPNTGSTFDDILGAINLTGSGTDTLNVDDTGSTTNKVGALTATTLTGLGLGGAGITYTGMSELTLSLGSGNDTFTIASTALIPVMINGDSGADLFNVQATTGTTDLNGGSGNDTFNLGSLAPGTLGNVNAIAGLLNLHGNGGSDVINVDDSGDAIGNTGTLTATTLTGLGLGIAVNFDAVESMNIALGSGDNTFNIQSTLATVTTTLTTSAGVDTVNVGNAAPSMGGTVNEIQGALVIVGSGNDILNVDDSGDAEANAGFLIPANLTGLGLGSGITYSGLATLNIFLGSGDDTFAVNDMTNETVTNIDGGAGANSAALNFTQDFGAKELTLTGIQTATLNVVANFTGLLNDDGTITTAVIGASLTSTGILNADAIDIMTVQIDLAGLVNVTGLLDSLTVQGGTPGKVIAGDVHTIAVYAGYGPKVLQVIEAGIERQIQALRVGGDDMPNSVTFAFLYDSFSVEIPQLTIRITNTDATNVRFDLALVTYSATAQFNLARVEAVGISGVSNVSLEGDILTSISQLGLDFLGLPSDSLSGVVLPLDNITGVAVRDTLPIGHIDVAGIQGLVFGFLTNGKGKPMTVQNALGSSGRPVVLWNILGSHAELLSATDAFLIPFSESHSVQLYAQTDRDFSLDLVLKFTDQLADNAAVRAHVQLQPAVAKHQPAAVTNIQLLGDGGSIDSQYAIANITSTGALGDVRIRGSQGLGGITAASIFGDINVLSGPIYGTIQTTGIRIDSVTGEETIVSGDLGTTITNRKGKVVGVTTISSGLGITGQIIVRGDLISTVKAGGNFSGTIAVEGNVGMLVYNTDGSVQANRAGRLTRFGGITAGANSGQIIVLGNVFGDLNFRGTLSGRIAVHGAAVSGLDAQRFGILSNLKVRSMTATAAVISGGMIGDAAGKTSIATGRAQGILAADGEITLARSSRIAATLIFENLNNTANGAVLDAIFTEGSVPLNFDSNGPLQGLADITTDLTNLVAADGSLSGTTP